MRPDPDNFIKKKNCVIGIPRCFSIYTLWPLYSWFFHFLGVETFISKNISPEGTARVESAYCFPAEIAHGAVQDILTAIWIISSCRTSRIWKVMKKILRQILPYHSKFTLLH